MSMPEIMAAFRLCNPTTQQARDKVQEWECNKCGVHFIVRAANVDARVILAEHAEGHGR